MDFSGNRTYSLRTALFSAIALTATLWGIGCGPTYPKCDRTMTATRASFA